MGDVRDMYARRHSDVLPKTRSSKPAPLLQRQVLTKSSNTRSFNELAASSLFEEYHQVADTSGHKAVERHRLQRKEDIISRHTTFFPKKLSEEEEVYGKSCKQLNTSTEYSYQVSNFPRGIMCLVNEELFYKSLECERRLGTDYDADELTSLFLDMGFIVQRYDNYTRKEMKMVLAKDVSEDYSKMSCAACCILSRGRENDIYAIDKPFPLSSVTRIFNTSNLNGIPKIMILNIEQGNDFMDPMETHAEEEVNEEEVKEASVVKKEDIVDEEDTIELPPGNDFVFAYSSIPGFYSWKNNTRGSWFLQSIFSVFKEHAHIMDMAHMLTRVNRKVSKKLARGGGGGGGASNSRRDISLLVSSLRADLFMFPPYGPLRLKKLSVKWLTQHE